MQSGEILSPEQAVEAGYLDEAVALEDVEARSIEVAGHLAATVHSSAFAMTRKIMRGADAERMEAELNTELSAFVVSS